MHDRCPTTDSRQRGSALLSAMILIGMIGTLLAGYFLMTRIDQSTSRSALDRTKGFYAAEAGANLRAESIRQIFVGYNRPTGVSPTLGSSTCDGTNVGSGDMACADYEMAGKTGTAQVINIAQNEVYNEDEVAERHRHHGLFIAFAPLQAPTIAVAIIVENGGGSSAAAPIARAVIDTWLEGGTG